jgi:hypothetical protein
MLKRVLLFLIVIPIGTYAQDKITERQIIENAIREIKACNKSDSIAREKVVRLERKVKADSALFTQRESNLITQNKELSKRPKRGSSIKAFTLGAIIGIIASLFI